MLLIFPPVAKPCEPPAGIARLAGALKAHGVPCRILDMNLEGLLFLFSQPIGGTDTWSLRAVKNIPKNIAAIRNRATYLSLARYRRSVNDLTRVLRIAGKERLISAGLADYQDMRLSPVRSRDLIRAAERPEKNLFYPYFKKRLPEIIEKAFSGERQGDTCGYAQKKPKDTIGFSLNYLSQAICTFSMIGFLKKEFPAIRIILGGGLVTSWLRKPGWRRNPFGNLVDHLIAGPGELPLLSLSGIHQGNPEHYAPVYADLPLEDYFSPGFILPYSGSSGCYWNKCSFCPENAEGNPYRAIAAEQAIADIQGLAAGTSPVLVHLLDNAVSPALMQRLALHPPGVPWYGFARICRDLTDPDYCSALKRSGCAMLKLGLESGDQAVLDRLQKGMDLETASRALKNLKKAGIGTYVYLLFGTPAETLAEARKTAEFVIRHREVITFLNLAIFNLPVCSKEAAAYETGYFYEGDLSLYTGFRHPHGWGRKEVRLFLENEFKRHPAVAAILRNEPPVFTSNHAAFFVRS